MRKPIFVLTRTAFLALAVAVCCHAGIIQGSVEFNTVALIGHPAGPFYLAFTLTDGAGIGNNTNFGSIRQIDLGVGGNALGSPILLGDASGDLTTGILLLDSQPQSLYAQRFLPGDRLRFTFLLTTNVDDPIPDVLSFAILDSGGQAIPTLQGAPLDFLVRIDLASDSPEVVLFSGDEARSPAAGGPPIAINGQLEPTDVPEPMPGRMVLMGLGATATIRLIAKRKQAKGLTSP